MTISRESLSDYSDSDLIELARAVQAKRNEASADFRCVTTELEMRMEEHGARLIEGDGTQAELVTTRSYDWDHQLLWDEVRPALTSATWREAVHEMPIPALKPNTVRLEALRKKLGDTTAGRAIERARIVKEKQSIVLKEVSRE